MSRLLFDIECNGFLEDVTTIHCLVIKDIDTGTVFSCAKSNDYIDIGTGLIMLQNADEIIAHNGIKFDIPVIKKLHPTFTYKKCTDTLTISRLLYPTIFDNDCYLVRSNKDFPKKMMGKHSLKAWGYRLGELKGDFAETNDWSTWTKEMQQYCQQDIEVTHKLYTYLMAQEPSPRSMEIEHEFQKIIHQQELNGFPFNVSKAQVLDDKLKCLAFDLTTKIKQMIPDKVVEATFIPKANRPALGYIKDVPIIKREIIEFNPNSRTQLIEHFQSKGWVPTEFTEKDNVAIDGDVLAKMEYPEAKVLSELFDVNKIIAFISGGTNAWLKMVKNGKIHGGVITNGANTGRVAHLNPNLGQIPSVKTESGRACRELFYAPDPYVMVGADLSQVELRILAHYLSAYDNGKYADIVCNGDIHTANQEAAGLPTRNDAKTFIYAFVYGAGNEKLGSIIEPQAHASRQKVIGTELRRKFLSKIPAMERLNNDVKYAFKSRGHIKGLDGRKLVPRAEYSALNTLIQGAGAVIAKSWNINFWEMAFPEVYQLAFVHDELQIMCLPAHADIIGKKLISDAEFTTEQYELKCKITAEYKIAKNWAGAH